MPTKDKTSKKLAHLDSEILLGNKKPTLKEVKSLAGSVLAQTPNKPKKRG